MRISNGIIILLSVSVLCVLSQSYPSGTTPIITNDSAVSASYSLYEAVIRPACVDFHTDYRSYPTGQSMENLIALIEKLEIRLYNTTDITLANNILGAEKLARILLRRFRFDGFDDQYQPAFKRRRDQDIDQINTAFLAIPEQLNTYYFPDYVYTKDELCSLFYILSHNIINTNKTSSYQKDFRGKHQINQKNERQYNPSDNKQKSFVSPFLVNSDSLYSIKEEGVASFRSNKNEAIAPARVLIGIIAGLSKTVKTSVRDVLSALGVTNFDSSYNKSIDPVLAMTLADLWGTGTSKNSDDRTYYYGISGEWASTTCTTHYGLTSVKTDKFDIAVNSNKGTKAEIRGGIDGYLIGKALKNAINSGTTTDASKLRLSKILRSYYSKPRIFKKNSLTTNYCDRNQQLSNDLQNTAILYNAIHSMKWGGNPSSLLPEFTTALQSAQQIESKDSNGYCERPSSNLDKNSPCETPSDIIFVIDGEKRDKLQISGDIVSSILGNLNNIRREGGAVSIFLNSYGKNSVNPNVQLPTGPVDWPLIAVSFNSTNAECSCRINDFNIFTPQPVANTGKLFLYLNKILFNYKWWITKFNYPAVPAKSVVLIDLSSVAVVPDSGQDRNDYNYYKDQLRYRHIDVRYFSVAENQELFKDILRDENDKETPGTIGDPNFQLGPNLAKKICESPATFQYNACHERKSENIKYVGYVTPGYKQNWAMYPQYFHNSSYIKFSFKADEGDIRVCFDRKFPPEIQDQNHCKELKIGEEKYFEISYPCKGQTFNSCEPLFFTIWGKDRHLWSQCLDERCGSLDQIKFIVKHSGVECGSGNLDSDSDTNPELDPEKNFSFEFKVDHRVTISSLLLFIYLIL